MKVFISYYNLAIIFEIKIYKRECDRICHLKYFVSFIALSAHGSSIVLYIFTGY